MIGRRTIVGLSLLCALLFSAIAVQSASAAESKNTTYVTCIKVPAGTGEFADSHCNVKQAGSNFGHTAIGGENPTKITLGNEAGKNAVLKGELGGVKLEITCTTVAGEGTVGNEEPAAKSHKPITLVTTEFSVCTVNKPAKCTVKNITVNGAKGVGVDGLAPGGNSMGVEFKPKEGEIFVTISLEDKGAEKCSLTGKPLEVKGTAIATGGTATQAEKQAGSTAIFTNAMTKETLSIGGKAAEFEASTTVRMSGAGGEPIAMTTTT